MSRRLSVLCILPVLILAACGAPGAASRPGTPTVSSAPHVTPAGTSGVTPPAAIVPPATTSTAATAATRTPTSTGPASTPSAQTASLYPFTYTDADGARVRLVRQPRRIVSLFPVNNDTVFSIGAGGQVIAVDPFTDWPKAATKKPVVPGSVQKFNVEKIVAMRPDLVLTGAGTEQVLDKPLRAAGIKVINTGEPASLRDTYTHILDLGRITGHPRAAEALVSRIKRSVAEVSRRTANAPRVSVYFESDASTPGKPYVYGPGTLVDEMIGLAGGRNVFGRAKSGYAQVSYEAIVRANPQVIVLGDAKGHVSPDFYSPVTVQQVKQRPGFDTISAVKHDRIVPINTDLFTPGPRLATGLEQLARALHPELFGQK